MNFEDEDDLDELEPFHKELNEYLIEYEKSLSEKYSKSTVNKHAHVISYCNEYICNYEGVQGFEEITFAMISSKMYYDFESNCQEGMSRQMVLMIIKNFFIFIYEKYGIQNEKLMKKLLESKVSKQPKRVSKWD